MNFVQVFIFYSRPFGCSLIFSSWLDGKPELWTLDPSGAAFGYRGAAAGKAKNNARTEIEKLDFDTLTVEEGLKHAARIIHSVHDEVKGNLFGRFLSQFMIFFLDRGFELELSWVTRDNPKHGRVPVDVAKAAEDAAKAELADSDSEDDM